MIEFQNVSFAYDQKAIVEDITLQLQTGKTWTIVGPNGCGKTTLLRLISGLIQPKDGSIFLDDRPLRDYSRREVARKIAILPQDRSIPAISVSSFVSHGRFPYLGLSRQLTAEDKRRIEEAMEQTGVYSLRHRSVKELSGGERQRVYMAMVFAQNTPYILLDEPTTYLDIAHQFATMQMIEQMKAAGKTVITVLHDLSLALHYSDQMIVMNHAQIIDSASPQDIINNKSLEEAFDVTCHPVTFAKEIQYIFKPKRF